MKSIVFFDIETTGLDVEKDQIIQLAAIKITEAGRQVFECSIKPTVPMTPGALEVHKITPDMYANSPEFKEIAPAIYEFIKGCDIGGHNVVFFDMQMLVRQLSECGFIIDIAAIDFVDTKALYRDLYPATLSASYKHLTGKDRRANIHDAKVDIEDTVELYEEMVCRNPEYSTAAKCAELTRLSGLIDLSGKIIIDQNGVVVFNFGKNKNKAVSEYQEYVRWILNNPDFPKTFKETLNRYIKRT